MNAFLKRSLDITASGISLVILAPFIFLIAVSVKITSPGSVFYSQVRIGENRKKFKLYKFRSMVKNADVIGSSVTKLFDDRITTIGKFIRRTKIDELPQLWNVLVGDMSIVGPRPDVPEIIDLYTPEMLRILNVRPGITSISSLHLRNEDALLGLAREPDIAYKSIILPAKVELAMVHVDNPSILFDLWIIFQTLWVLVVGNIHPIPEHPMLNTLRQSIILLNFQTASLEDV